MPRARTNNAHMSPGTCHCNVNPAIIRQEPNFVPKVRPHKGNHNCFLLLSLKAID